MAIRRRYLTETCPTVQGTKLDENEKNGLSSANTHLSETPETRAIGDHLRKPFRAKQVKLERTGQKGASKGEIFSMFKVTLRQ